ncbi:MAG: HIT family protein [Candidatus Brocadiia bacterium]
MNAETECVFCQIIAGDIPAATLIETEKVLSFLDIAPVNPGHALVIPKRHVETLLDLTQDELHKLVFMVQRIARATTTATDADGFNVLQNNHECAGQEIPHLHFHVIPRFFDDDFKFGWRQQSYEEGEIESLQQDVKKLL